MVFYVQRIPDQITGPFVEVGTVFRTFASRRDRRQRLGRAGDGSDRRRVAPLHPAVHVAGWPG